MFDGFGYDRVLGVFTDADFGFVCLCFRGSGLTVVVFFFWIRQVMYQQVLVLVYCLSGF